MEILPEIHHSQRTSSWWSSHLKRLGEKRDVWSLAKKRLVTKFRRKSMEIICWLKNIIYHLKWVHLNKNELNLWVHLQPPIKKSMVVSGSPKKRWDRWYTISPTWQYIPLIYHILGEPETTIEKKALFSSPPWDFPTPTSLPESRIGAQHGIAQSQVGCDKGGGCLGYLGGWWGGESGHARVGWWWVGWWWVDGNQKSGINITSWGKVGSWKSHFLF